MATTPRASSSTACRGAWCSGPINRSSRLVFRPDQQILTPALPAAAADAAIASYVQGPDAWFEFNYASLLEQLVSS